MFNPFQHPAPSFQDRYGIQMLCSLGHLFLDKSLNPSNGNLNWDAWQPHDRYALCCYAAEQLHNDHGYDLRQTASDYYRRRKMMKSDNENEQSILVEPKYRLQVPVCTLTPLRTIFQPLELTTGSRALRNQR